MDLRGDENCTKVLSMPKVIFEKSGVEAEWTDEHDSLLELAEAEGLDLDYGCRIGSCTACQQPVTAGKIAYPNGHTGVPDEGNELLCCSQPKGDDDVVIQA